MDLDPVFFLCVFVSILIAFAIHEFAHGWAAYQLGDPTAKYEGRLTLNPIKHLDLLGAVVIFASLVVSGGRLVFGWGKPVRFDSDNFRNPFRDGALVAAAGPAVNYLAAAVLALPFLLGLLAPGSLLFTFLNALFMVNLGLALFNCIPCPPLDGWKILQAFVPRARARTMQRWEVKGGMVPLLVLLLFIKVGVDPVGPVFTFIYRAVMGMGG